MFPKMEEVVGVRNLLATAILELRYRSAQFFRTSRKVKFLRMPKMDGLLS